MKPLPPRPRTTATDTSAALEPSPAGMSVPYPTGNAIPEPLRVLARLLGRQAAEEWVRSTLEPPAVQYAP